MPLEQLLQALERDATAQAEALLAEARAAAATLTSEADQRLARRRSDVLGAREAELRAAAEVALGDSRRAARRRELEARQRVLDRVFAAARDLFPDALAGGVYRAVLPQHLAQALHAIGDEPAVIHCPERLVKAVRAALPRHRHLRVEGDPTAAPGITVAIADGAITVDNTLDGRLERLRPRLAIAVLARLEAAP